MIVKAFEIRDKATFVPAIAIKMVPEMNGPQFNEAERYLLRRAGFNVTKPASIILCRMSASGTERNATYDPYAWGINRSMHVAHLHLEKHFDALESGAVIDVEFILEERGTPKVSERVKDPC